MTDFTTKFAGTIKDFDPTQVMSAKDARKYDVFVQYGVAAGAEAVKNSGIMDFSALDLKSRGCFHWFRHWWNWHYQLSHAVLSQSGPKRIHLLHSRIHYQYGFR